MITVKRKVQLTREAHGRRRVAAAKKEQPPVTPGRIPRISRLMAVAIRLEHLLLMGVVSPDIAPGTPARVVARLPSGGDR